MFNQSNMKQYVNIYLCELVPEKSCAVQLSTTSHQNQQTLVISGTAIRLCSGLR